MSIKISTLLNKIDSFASKENATIIMDFYNYMQEGGSSENHKVNNLRVVMGYAKYVGNTCLYNVNKRGQILSFLNTKIKYILIDPDKRWITTWNHYLNRLKLFYRWLYNVRSLSGGYNNNNNDGYYN
jgi:integrase/recombinase XerD